MKLKILLFGGFSGWLNFGDILQLKSWLLFYKDKGFKSTVLLNKNCLQSPFHLEILKELIKEDFIFYGDGKFWNANLEDLQDFQVDVFHLYGGGFLNAYWGKAKLEVIEKALLYFNPKKYFITGQQISSEFLPYLKAHLNVFQPEVFAVRDKESLRLCKENQIPAEFSFDDSVEYLIWIRDKLDLKRPNNSLEVFSNTKRVIFLHLNLSYYVLQNEEEVWNYRETLRKILKQVKKVYFVKTYQSYNIEVKDTFRALDYLFLTLERPEGKFLDLVSLLIKEEFSELRDALNESETVLALTNSYHTALFFSFLELSACLLRLNPYYEQKAKSLFAEHICSTDNIWERLSEIKHIQQEKLKGLLEERKAFIDSFENLLIRKSSDTRMVFDRFTYIDVPDKLFGRVEVDNYINENISWFKKELDKTNYQLDRLKNKVENLERQLESLKWERDNLKTELERIYSSRGWKFLTIYYKIKHRLLVTMGLIKGEGK